MVTNTYNLLKPLFKEKYGKPAKGVYLKQPSMQVYKPKAEFKKLKSLIKI